MQPLRVRASTRARLLVGVSAITLAAASCDPIPGAAVQLGPQPRSRMPAPDSLRATVTRVLGRHGIKPAATPCEGNGHTFLGDVPDTLSSAGYPLELRACLSVGPDTAAIHFTEWRRGWRLTKESTAIVRSLADSLRAFANVRVFPR